MEASGGQKQRNCVGCGRSIIWDANLCPYCGHDYRPQMQPAQSRLDLSEGSKVILYILSLLIWPVGFVLAFVYNPKPDPESREFGKMCIYLGSLGLILWIFFILMWSL